MFLRSQLTWNVVIPAEDLDGEGLMLQRAILVRIMNDFAERKASNDLGYFLAITTLNSIGEGKIRLDSGELLFPVSFSCITFKMFPGEVLEATVHKIFKQGLFLSCGSVDKLYLSHKKMGEYQYVPGENHFFRNGMSLKIEKGTVLRIVVIGVKYCEAGNEFHAVVSMDGDYLGPVNHIDTCF